jgi:hypothetical protein
VEAGTPPGYDVTFYGTRQGQIAPLYSIEFSQYSGLLESFEDRREDVSDQEVAVAKQAMIKRVGGLPDNFTMTIGAHGDHVEAWIWDNRPNKAAKKGHCIISRKTLKVIKFELLP